MRIETEEAIKRKFIYYIEFEDPRTKEPSAKHAIECLREIGIKKITEDVLKAFLFSVFATMCYDITAMLEARGVRRRETIKLWNETSKENQEKIKRWMNQAKSFTQEK